MKVCREARRRYNWYWKHWGDLKGLDDLWLEKLIYNSKKNYRRHLEKKKLDR